MLKLYKRNFKVFGIISCSLLLSLSYVGLSFYSVPEKANAANNGGIEEWRTLNDITYMQEMTIDICNNSDIGDSKALIDKRGGGYDNDGIAESYVVQKLGDGNCWMVQNMKLDLDAEGALTSENSDVFTAWPDKEALKTVKSTAIWADDNAKPYYRNNPSSLPVSNGAGTYQEKYGYYYNWCAATAGTCVNSGEAASSICSKGWELPTSNKGTTVNGSFNKLDSMNKGNWTTSNDNGLFSAPGYYFGYGFFPAAGNVYSGALRHVGSNGGYWSSVTDDSDTAYGLYFNSSSMKPSNGWARWNGLPVRCVNNPNIHSGPIGEYNTDISVQVGSTLTIDAAEGMRGEVDYTRILEGEISATVSSNLGYTVMLSVAEPALTNETNIEHTITPVVGITTLQKGTTGWGIWTGSGDTVETRTYEPVNNSPQAYYNTTTPAADGIGTVHTFGVGIAVSPSIPNGTYSTVVTVTAANA